MFFNKLHNRPQVIAIILASCLAMAAQYLFTGDIFIHKYNSNAWLWTSQYSVALFCLVLATAFATWAALPPGKVETVIPAAADNPNATAGGRRTWLFASGACYILSIVLFLVVGENSLVRWLWVGGMVLLIIPLWLRGKAGSPEDHVSSRDWLFIGIISLIGFILRYYKLTEIPSHVDNDVAFMGTFAVDLIGTEQYNWFGLSGSGHLLSYDQFLAWSMRLFGQNHYGIVMFSVILGTLSLVFVFLLGRELGGRFVGFVAIALLTINYTHIHFSRILFGNSSSFPAIVVFYALFKGLRTKEYLWFAIAGIFAGWAILLYDSGRVIPVILIAVMVWQWLWHRQSFNSGYKYWGILFLGMLLAVGPTLAYAVRNFSDFAGRANTVVLWTPVAWQHELAVYNTTSPVAVLWQQTWRTFLALHLTGDGSPHFTFPHPMVDPLTALLFILGLGYALGRIKDVRYFSILGWIVFTFILGGVLTADPPYWPHLNITLPAIVVMAGVGAENFSDKLTMVFGRVGRNVYSWMLLGAIIVTGIQNWGLYYDYVKNNAGNRIRIARYVESLPSSYHVYLIGGDLSWNESAFRFFSQGTSGTDLTTEQLMSDPPKLEFPIVFILFRHPEVTSILLDLYPGGVLENHYDVNNLVSFISYRVVPSTIDVPPQVPAPNPLGSTGWLLVFGLLIFWIGYVAYIHYSALEILPNDGQQIG